MCCRLGMLLGLFAVFAAAPSSARAQGVDFIKANYTKFEYRIPMRDGTKLFTAVYVPKDDSKTYPMLMSRTPYSCQPYGVDNYRDNLGPSPLFGKALYIVVYQDVRGRWMSEGEFVNMRPHRAVKKLPADIDESSDTYDTIEFLLKQVKGHNGRVGMWGISYPGFYSAAGAIDAHRALKAISPQAPVADWFVGDDWHHNGAFFLTHCFNFMAGFGRPRPEPVRKLTFKFDHDTPDGYDFFLRMGPLSKADAKYFRGEVAFWNEVQQHGTYDDFWKARNIRPHLKDLRPAVMTVGGWFDAENLYGALEVYRRVEATSPHAHNTLVMGPWDHGGWAKGDGRALGHAQFHSATAEFYREQIEFPFFEHFLKDEGKLPHPEAWVFETGTNVWRKYDVWPPKYVKKQAYYFHAGGKLANSPPSEDDGMDSYLSDPAKPVPYQEKIDTIMSPDHMVADQRFAARRPDVLVYQTDVLESDVTWSGPIDVRLVVSTSGSDSDFVVKVIDVHPSELPDVNPNPTGFRRGNYQQLLRGDVMRGKFRNSLEKPQPFEPNQPTAVHFTMQDICHTFRAGHRIMVQVQSSWFPLVDRNPQKFCDIYHASEADFQIATQRVYRGNSRPSRVEARVTK